MFRPRSILYSVALVVTAAALIAPSLAAAAGTTKIGLPVYGWGSSHAVPGTGRLNAGGDWFDGEAGPSAAVTGVSCPAVGSCVVTGSYTVGQDVVLPFIEVQSSGHL